MVERLRSAHRVGAGVAVTRIVAIVDMAIKSVTGVIPGSSPDEYSTSEPARAVVTVRRAAIRCITVIAIRANRCSITAVHGPNSNANTNLCLGRRG